MISIFAAVVNAASGFLLAWSVSRYLDSRRKLRHFSKKIGSGKPVTFQDLKDMSAQMMPLHPIDPLLPLIAQVMAWKCPEGIQVAVFPFPLREFIAVLMSHERVSCSVPIGCVCCAWHRLDVVAQILIDQAEVTPYHEELRDAFVKFETAIQEIGK